MENLDHQVSLVALVEKEIKELLVLRDLKGFKDLEVRKA